MKVESAEFIRSVYGAEDFPRDGLAEVAFVGRSNVGKSSLLNTLLGRKKLARISSTPGRTRAINYFLINRRLYFVDLPGFGYAKVAKDERRRWAALMDDYFRQRTTPGESGRLKVIHLVDAKVGATDLDREATEYFLSLGVDRVVVATKFDRVGRSKRAAALSGIGRALGLHPGEGPLPVSARSGEGIKELWSVIDDHLRDN